MTDRERWIVYPLLALALGTALRDKIVSAVQVREIACGQLTIVGEDGKPQLQLGNLSQNSRELSMFDREGRKIAGIYSPGDGRSVRLMLGQNGKPGIQLAADQGAGGHVILYSQEGQATVAIHSDSAGKQGQITLFDHEQGVTFEPQLPPSNTPRASDKPKEKKQ